MKSSFPTLTARFAVAVAVGLIAFSATSCASASNDIIINGRSITDSAGSDSRFTYVTREYSNLGYFDEIEISRGIAVNYSVGTERKVVVTVSDNAVDDLSVEVHGGTLCMTLDRDNVNLDEISVKAEVTGSSLESVETSSAGSFRTCDRLGKAGETLSLNSSSAGIIRIESTVTCGTLDCSASSASGIYVTSTKAAKVNVDISSASRVEIDGIDADVVDTEASSASKAVLAGTARKAILEASSTAGIDAGKLKAEEGRAEASSFGSITSCIKNPSKLEHDSGGKVRNK